ncbi:TetR family transcriptional regulator [Rugosimonospora africana]|uniref:TetR family transcriptional regulator n=2 Tax=Rugosimonospora africana TaxID=556532 RepID=A0A8J3VRK5_9ACTN|nr:TetR family transcriptional regulator [Rugosimonospora africana]
MRADAQRNRVRILSAAADVFAAGGPEASTEEVARRAGVAIGTVFRHFPTKADLLRALMKEQLRQLTDDAATLIAGGDPRTALFEFFSRLVERTAASRTVVHLLAAQGLDVPVAGPVGSLSGAVGELLAGAQRAGAVRPGIRADEVTALMVSACQGALHGGWSPDLRERTLGVMFAGLRPPGESGVGQDRT